MFLTDSNLIPLLSKADADVQGVRQPADWYSADSPVQPASVDLSIVRIHLPGTDKEEPGGELNPKTQHILKPGETAVIATQEEFNLPGDVLGLGFPPSRVSFQGILMTNPWHIDPGYRGPLRFTIINMGSQDYVVRKGDAIGSVLLFKLTAPAHAGWLQRHNGKPGGYPKQDDINKPAGAQRDPCPSPL